MKFRSHALRFLALCALLATGATAHAETGELLVTVASVENRPLAGSTITVESRTGEIKQAIADADGRAMVRDLAVGLYRVAAQLQGFRPVAEPAIRVVRDASRPCTGARGAAP